MRKGYFVNRIIVARHGDYNDRLYPSFPLTKRGKEEMRQLGEQLRRKRIGVTKIFSSVKPHAKESARILARAIVPGVELPVEVDERLSLDYEYWEQEIEETLLFLERLERGLDVGTLVLVAQTREVQELLPRYRKLRFEYQGRTPRIRGRVAMLDLSDGLISEL